MRYDLVEKYDQQVPRYTSYPTAPHFHEGVSGETYGAWLEALSDEQTLSLYFHVPFCAAMCWFCGCHTKVTRKYEPIAAYVEHLLKEIDLVAAKLKAAPRVTSVHWGGGSPTGLSPEDFSRLMARVRERFSFADDVEIAVEIDPRTMTREFLEAMVEAGVNRASIGVQDFNADVQAAINRIQPFALIERWVNEMRAVGILGINFDLIYGLPHQTVDHVIENVKLAARLAPHRLSVFGYAHVPWMKTHQKMIADKDLPGTAERFEQSQAIARELTLRGYVHIGLDHFARRDDPMAEVMRAGKLRRNFQGYTVDSADALLGFGASAIGKLPQGYVQNEVPMHAYGRKVEAGELATARGFELSEEDIVRARIIERLMCGLHVDMDDFGGAQAWRSELFNLAPLIVDGIVTFDGSRITIPEWARPFMRLPCAEFDAYLKPQPARYSKAI